MRYDMNNLVYDGESSSFDEFGAAFKYDAINYGWDEAKQIQAIKLCLVAKAKKFFQELTNTEKASIKSVLEKLKKSCVKSPEYYLNLFYSRQLKSDEKISTFCYEIEKLIDKGLPGLDDENRTRMLRSRLLSAVPENIKNYLELLSDKKWSEIVGIFDKSVDYKEIYQGQFQIKEEVDLNRVEQSRPKQYRFNGTCNFCHRQGHKAVDCYARKNQVQKPYIMQNSSKNQDNERNSSNNSQNRSSSERYESSSNQRSQQKPNQYSRNSNVDTKQKHGYQN